MRHNGWKMSEILGIVHAFVTAMSRPRVFFVPGGSTYVPFPNVHDSIIIIYKIWHVGVSFREWREGELVLNILYQSYVTSCENTLMFF